MGDKGFEFKNGRDYYQLESSLEHVETELNDDISRIVKDAKAVRNKQERAVEDFEDLMHSLNALYNVSSDISQLERAIKQHENAVENGMNKEDAEELFDHDIEEVVSDIEKLKKAFNEVNEDLQKFKEDLDDEAEGTRELKQIDQRLEDDIERLDDLEQRGAEIKQNQGVLSDSGF